MYMNNPHSYGEEISNQNPFADKDDNSILIVVEDTNLYINEEFLKLLSPVFRAMLSEKFVEGQQKKIELKEKKEKDVITLFRFFYPSDDIEFTEYFDFYPLLAMCEEYQLCWLRKKFIRYINRSFEQIVTSDNRSFKQIVTSDDVHDGAKIVYYLYLAERFNLEELKKLCLYHDLKINVSSMGKNQNLSFVSNESKRAIYKKYLKRRMNECNNSCRMERRKNWDRVKYEDLLNSVDNFFELIKNEK